MLRCRRIATPVLAVTLLAGCSQSRHPSTPPATTGSRLVASSHSALPSGDSTEAGKPGTVAIAAANAHTGKFLWRVPVNGDFQVFSGMVLDGESLYGQWASCDNNHAGVAAIDLATGQVRWRTDTLYQGETLPNALPQSALGGLYVTVGGGMNESDHGVTITAVDIANGKVRWTRKLADPPSGPGGSLALDQAVVAVATGPEGVPGGTITALDRATGQVLWTSPLPTGAASWSSIAADNDHIYATHMSNPTDPSSSDFVETTLAFAARTGKPVWQHVGGTPRPSRPGGHVVALETGLNGPSPSLIGLDSDTGQQRWQRNLAPLGDRSDTADGRVVMAGPPAGVHVVDIASGKDAWSRHDHQDVIATRANGIVLWNGTGNGSSTLYDAATGAHIGAPAQLPAEPDQVTVPPQIDADGRLILARGCPGRG
jgi:outer membrane protein assembly factor BamB